MGYTHYFTFNKTKTPAAKVEKQYQLAVGHCQKLVRSYYKQFGGLSGYSAHTKQGAYGGLLVNGKGDEGHEEFSLREHFKQNEGFNFCKTARKPYDLVIVGCLAILKHYLKDAIDVSSDGDCFDWNEGVAYAAQVTNLSLDNPIKTGRNGINLKLQEGVRQ